jgi:hypothetical protein
MTKINKESWTGQLVTAYEKILEPTYESETLDKANEAICKALQTIEKLVREKRIPDPDEYQELYRKSTNSKLTEAEREDARKLMYFRLKKYAKDHGTIAPTAHRALIGAAEQ